MDQRPVLRVALVGTAFMGKAHSNAWRQVERFFPELPYRIERAVLVGRDAAATTAAAARLGWDRASTDLDAVLADPSIGAIDIATPNDSHHPLALKALAAGKAVLCEKPLALNLAQAREMAAAAQGKPTLVWQNYRRAPAVATATKLVAEGRLGDIRQVRATYLQDWLGDANSPASWRMNAATCGSGAHGDLNAHLIDLIRGITGREFRRVSGLVQTFTRERPTPEGGRITVDVDDASLILGELENGATVSCEASRVATGRKNAASIEINGTRGSLAWTFERMNELQFFSLDDSADTQGFRTIMCMSGAHPFAGNWWPDGHVLGYEHTFVNTLADFLVSLAAGTRHRPDFADGLATQAVLDTALAAAREGRWLDVPR